MSVSITTLQHRPPGITLLRPVGWMPRQPRWKGKERARCREIDDAQGNAEQAHHASTAFSSSCPKNTFDKLTQPRYPVGWRNCRLHVSSPGKPWLSWNQIFSIYFPKSKPESCSLMAKGTRQQNHCSWPTEFLPAGRACLELMLPVRIIRLFVLLQDRLCPAEAYHTFFYQQN